MAGEGSDLGPDRGDDPAGQLVGAAVARELGQQQRIAARLRIEPVALAGAGHARQQRLGGPALQGPQIERDEADREARALRGEQPLGRGPRAQPDREQQRIARRAAHEVLEQLTGRRVGPVDVVDEQQQRTLGGDEAEQLAERAVQAPAFGDRAGRRARRAQPGQDVGEQPELLGSEPRQRIWARERRLERVDDRHERDVVLELGRASLEDDEALCRPKLSQLGQQARLADARLAAHGEQTSLAARYGVERARDGRELCLSAVQAAP